MTKDLTNLLDINKNNKDSHSIVNRIKMRVMPLVRGLSKHITKHSEYTLKNRVNNHFNLNIFIHNYINMYFFLS